jgi:hypothetical protein
VDAAPVAQGDPVGDPQADVVHPGGQRLHQPQARHPGQGVRHRRLHLVRRHVDLDLVDGVRHVPGRVDQLVAQTRGRIPEQGGFERQPDEWIAHPDEPTGLLVTTLEGVPPVCRAVVACRRCTGRGLGDPGRQLIRPSSMPEPMSPVDIHSGGESPHPGANLGKGEGT